MQRKIIHCDADCFFAAIEMRDDPSLRGRPVAVGGDASRRGVISTCNYEAREYGVRSAMASAHAMRLCRDLLIIPPNMEKYRRASKAMRDIFFDYTDLVEPLSLDEAFLDVSTCERHAGSATLIARDIRTRIADKLGITVSAGVAPNKFLAKIASDINKPNGLYVITPGDVERFVSQLPVKKIHGVGKVTAEKLRQFGIETCADLQRYDLLRLAELFGTFGKHLFELARGIDDRPVISSHRRKSLSVENTYSQDLDGVEECLARLPELFHTLRSRLNRLDEVYLINKAFVKVKYSDFTSTTLEKMGTTPDLTTYRALMEEVVQRQQKPIRLLGIGVRLIDTDTEQKSIQLDLFKNYPRKPN